MIGEYLQLLWVLDNLQCIVGSHDCFEFEPFPKATDSPFTIIPAIRTVQRDCERVYVLPGCSQLCKVNCLDLCLEPGLGIRCNVPHNGCPMAICKPFWLNKKHYLTNKKISSCGCVFIVWRRSLLVENLCTEKIRS